ncbi:MAG: CRISPR-associated protein Cas4 [Ruminococcus sp.]|nr:CRISPR-associated protein Cas4 [Ruminococcus sp.]
MYSEEEYLLLSGIQHFVFCRRQWALIHIEQQWEENLRTADGRILHRNVHDSGFHEKRRDTVIARAMAVSSSRLGLSGECDVVEFRQSADGVPVFGLDGTYSVTPVEYKRGEPKQDESDVMQLTAQAMCLEEMLCCEIPQGYLFYGETRRRLKVEFDEALRQRTEAVIEEMHMLYSRSHTPKAKRTRACNACSLKEICLPALAGRKTASAYLKEMLGEEA